VGWLKIEKIVTAPNDDIYIVEPYKLTNESKEGLMVIMDSSISLQEVSRNDWVIFLAEKAIPEASRALEVVY